MQGSQRTLGIKIKEKIIMLDLFDRLYPGGEGKSSIGVHYFRAALGDYAKGFTTRNKIVNAFNLDTEAQTDLDKLLAKIDSEGALGKVAFLLELHDVMMIAESGLRYSTKTAFKTRMGL